MSFQFVDNGKIDGAARKLIRSHVMKGKNAGKIRPRSTRKGIREEPFATGEYTADLLPPTFYKSAEGDETEIVSIPRTIGSSVSYFTFPCQMQPYMRDLIYQFFSVTNHAVYPKEFCLPVGNRNLLWFQYLLSDEAFFHSVLAMSEVCADSLSGRQETSPRALRHLSNAYCYINQNLQKHGTPSDPTIASVVSLAIQEDLRGQPSRSKIHIDALQRMVELRGGISHFGTNFLLVHKICRADIEYALHNGSYPCFNRDEFPSKMIQSMLGQSVFQKEDFSMPDCAQIYDRSLKHVIVDTMNVTRLLNGNQTFFRLEPYAFQEILISICYRLLHHYPLATDGLENGSENAYRLGLLALVTTIFFQHGRSQRLSYDLLAEKLHIAIDSMSSARLIEETVFLWLLFVGGISVFNAADMGWLLPKIKICLFRLRTDSWPKVRDKIRNLPWIDVVHDRAGQELWQSIVRE